MRQRQSVTLEYFVMEQYILIWVISPAGDIHYVLSPVPQGLLHRIVGRLMHLIELPKLNERQREELSQTLKTLYTYLIEPVPARLLPSSPEEVVTIIPHGPLFRIPFAALKNRAGRYLIEDHALVYAPSQTLLHYTAHNAQQVIHAGTPDLLAFVNPSPFPPSTLPALPNTEQDFDYITQFYQNASHNVILKGSAATKQRLSEEASFHTILCFATHAQVNDDDPLQSSIALAEVTPGSGYLRMPDIAQLTLHTTLVILSACRTGRGKLTGDGVIGLSRAFFQAGTPSLLVSLWSIPEKESIDQLFYFHRYWREQSQSKAQALQATQLQRLHRYRDQPDVWAGFALIGEWQ
jgi:CHAT domain-containing protein